MPNSKDVLRNLERAAESIKYAIDIVNEVDENAGRVSAATPHKYERKIS